MESDEKRKGNRVKTRTLLKGGPLGWYSQPTSRHTEDTKPSNPKDAAATSRLDLSLFPASARAYGALALAEGDLKYGGFNYRIAGVMSSVYYAAAGRHMDKWFNGENYDPKTRIHHLASALACIAVLIDGIEQGNLNDDRPPRQDSRLYERMEEHVEHLQEVFPRRVPRYRADPGDLPLPEKLDMVSVRTGSGHYRVLQRKRRKR